ncbi:pyruvate carboxylase subunit a [Holotrichia oblita]|nr:pyruvate carboxylase subunit a [Holotrichia oblita]
MIEESPSPAISDEVRAKMIDVSGKAAKAVGYVNLGTIEFLYDKSGNFYFMEMNTRLQVEHPVTEMITGIDLVKWQIRVAAGMELNFTQETVRLRGAALECRINAENPYNGFRPDCGKIELLHIPGGPWVRFDTAIYQNYVIPPFYDSMIGKLIVYAKTREEAIRKMKAALCELVIEGVDNNADFQLEILSDSSFIDGSYNTKTVDGMVKV